MLGSRKPASPIRYFNSSADVIRLVEDLLFGRGIDICHETVRLWWNRFGPLFAADVRRQRVGGMRGFRQWKWHLDEAYVKINGETHYPWRAVDQEGEVLESDVTKTLEKGLGPKVSGFPLTEAELASLSRNNLRKSRLSHHESRAVSPSLLP